MSVSFSTSKNGEETCIIDSTYIHSRYAPSNEIKRWVDNIQCDFKPLFVFVIAPGIPYCSSFFKDKFPDAKLILLHFFTEFEKYDSNSFLSLYYKNELTAVDFSEMLFDYFGEEVASRILFVSYKPCENLLQSQIKTVFEGISLYLKKSRDVIATRTFFSKKWFLNTVRFFKNIHEPYRYNSQKLTCDVLIAASGPTLKDSLPYIIQYRSRFFLLAVSSSVNCLIENNIIPDLVISTDGGYWAKKHLEILEKNRDIPLCISCESALPYSVYQNRIVPINYDDFLENALFKLSDIDSINLSRNGTVSGNALEIALKLTNKNVYMVGVDLQSGNGFPHSQPNVLENFDKLRDFKLNNTETRITKRKVFSSSLEVYKNWFASIEKERACRIKRLCIKTKALPDLGFIKTCFWENINFSENNFVTENKFDFLFEKQSFSNKNDKIKDFLVKLSKEIELLDEKSHSLKEYDEIFKMFSLGHYLHFKKFSDSSSFQNAKDDVLSCLEKGIKAL